MRVTGLLGERRRATFAWPLANVSIYQRVGSTGSWALARVHSRHALRASLKPLPVNDESRLPNPAPAAIFKQLTEGGVLLSTTDEVYFGVNQVGAKIWSLLPPSMHTFGELCIALERDYPDTQPDRIRADARQFIESLIESGLAVAPVA